MDRERDESGQFVEAISLEAVVDDPAPEAATDIDPDDPLFTGEPLLAPDDPVDETEIDDILYGTG